MNSNGQNRNNIFAGDVYVNGDLTVTGNINGGGGGGGDVNNPMTENLDAGNFNITNVNTLSISSLTSPNPTINCNSKSLTNLNAIQLSNGLYFSAAFPPEENYVLYVAGGNPAGPIIDYKKAVFNPVEENINMDNKSITNNNNVETKGISSSTGATAFTSILNMFNDINMNYHDIFNVERLTASHASVSLNLDMIPMTEGKAGQVLARDPAFIPGNFATHKLVWTNQSAGGGVNNPMTESLEAGTFSIYNANIVECKNINILLSGSGLSCVNGTLPVPITWGLAQKLTLDPFYKTFNTDYITPATSSGLTLDSKAPDGITDTKITLSTPTLNFNNSTNLAPTDINITGNLQITNSSGYIHGNNLIVRGRNALAVPTPITIEGTTTSINSSTLNITSSTANNFLGAVNTNFSGTVRTNTIDANSGGNISVLQNLTLATGRQLRTDLVFSDGLRSYTTDLIIAGLLPDNKTQTNILISSPIITLNNQFDPLVTENCLVNILGTLNFDNTVTDSIIKGGYIMIDSKYTNNTATPLYLKGSEIEMTSSIEDIKITVPENKYIDLQGNVIVGDGKTSQIQVDALYPRSTLFVKSSNFSTRYRLYSHMHALDNNTTSRNVRTSLFKYYGPNTFITSLNTITPTIITTSNGSAVGSKIQDTNHLNSGDRLCFTLTGLLTTAGGGSMNIYVYAGVAGSLVQVTSFTKPNIVLNNEPVKITIDCDIIKTPGAISLNNVAFCTLHRNDNAVCNLVGTIGATIPDDAQTQYEIYATHTVTQAGSTFKLLTYSMELY